MPSAWVVSQCYRGGLLGYFLQWWFAAWVPLFLWWALYGRLGDPHLRSYFWIYYNTYLPSWLFTVLLRDVVIKSPAPNPACNSTLYTMPSVEIVLMTQYYVMGVFHHLALKLAITWSAALRALTTYVFVFGMLAWSGFYSWADLFAGVGFGVLFSLFFSYWIYDFWLPRYPFLNGVRWISKVTDVRFVPYPPANARGAKLQKWHVL